MNKDQLQFIIDRYDHYYDSVNNKGQFYLGLNTLIMGGLGAAFSMLNTNHCCTTWLYVLVSLMLAAGSASSFYTLCATLPYLKSGNSKPSSLIFFGSVSKLSQKEFLSRSLAVTDQEVNEDLSIQAHQLATGLSLKFKHLKVAGVLIAIEFALLVPFLILFFINVKK